MTVVMASDTCKRCCLCKTYSMTDSRLPLLRSTRYKKQFNTFHCGGTIYLSASDTQDCNKTMFRNTETMAASDMITHLAQALLRDKDKAALGLVSWLFWILLKCLMMLWTYLLTYFSMCEWVCMSAQDQFFGCLFLCLCLVSNRVKGFCVACLYLILWGCASSYALTFDEQGDNKGQKSSKLRKHSLFQSTAHKSSILRYAQRHEASSSGLKSNLLVFPKCSGMSVIIDWTLLL